MLWNWQHADWPHFRYDRTRLESREAAFLHKSGVLIGTARHLAGDEQAHLAVELMSTEALQTSAIEGDVLDRDSVQSSIRRHFGLATDHRRIPPAEQGIAQMMVDLVRTFQAPLSHDMMFAWHRALTNGRQDLQDVGHYRTQGDPMQVVSGPLYAPKVHFEAPPAARMAAEMADFVEWFNATAPAGRTPLPALARAGIAPLYFASIHPFEDGNGRIGRAIAHKALAQSLGQPTLMVLADTIEWQRKAYYAALERSSRDNEVTDWLVWFADLALMAQDRTLARAEFIIKKTKLFDRLRGDLNPRQEKALLRMFREGPDGFKGGLSAENYIGITKSSRATATRDLHDLVALGALIRTGERKHTRYHLNLDQSPPDAFPLGLIQ